MSGRRSFPIQTRQARTPSIAGQSRHLAICSHCGAKKRAYNLIDISPDPHMRDYVCHDHLQAGELDTGVG